MDRFIAQANVDHFVSLLNGSDLTPRNRDTVVRLLIAEEDKLGHGLEQLEFAESRTAQSWDRLNYARKLRDGLVEGSTDRQRADVRLENFEAIHELFEQFCHQLRVRVSSSLL